ncbi:hypothetical protein ACNO8X_18365 [Mycobacterium sp. PDNC021]|uniref:hypothetical protein n=1 Tax=Mycobacterium sp. PDNC021 TaxID=3391399 RepID=UPI003AAA7F4D
MANVPMLTDQVGVWRARRNAVGKFLASKPSLAVIASLGVLVASLKTIVGILGDLDFSQSIARWVVVSIFVLGCAVIVLQQSPSKKT